MRRPSILILAALCAILVAGSTTAATARSTATIRACIDLNGTWTDGRTGCANDNWVTWNSEGPAGPIGPAGAAGSQGEPGPQGPAGALPPGVATRLTARLRQLQTLEAQIAKTPRGSALERARVIAALRLQRQTTSDLIAALSG